MSLNVCTSNRLDAKNNSARRSCPASFGMTHVLRATRCLTVASACLRVFVALLRRRLNTISAWKRSAPGSDVSYPAPGTSLAATLIAAQRLAFILESILWHRGQIYQAPTGQRDAKCSYTADCRNMPAAMKPILISCVDGYRRNGTQACSRFDIGPAVQLPRPSSFLLNFLRAASEHDADTAPEVMLCKRVASAVRITLSSVPI